MGAPIPDTEALTERAASVVRWWSLGLVSADDVRKWADAIVVASEAPGELPAWLFALSLRWPEADLESDIPRTVGDFASDFRVMVEAIDPDDPDAIGKFARWVARDALGEAVASAEVMAGYEIDALLDHDLPAAIERAREIIAEYRPHCNEMRAAMPWKARRMG